MIDCMIYVYELLIKRVIENLITLFEMVRDAYGDVIKSF